MALFHDKAIFSLFYILHDFDFAASLPLVRIKVRVASGMACLGDKE
jgi:hypothetical protein